jgi:arylsulfatase A-like enzyme
MHASKQVSMQVVGKLSAVLASIAVPAVSPAQEEPPFRRPNIVLMVADDLGPMALSCYGNSQAKTAAIDSLAEEGMAFENAYSTSPHCTPGRSSLLTGLYPQGHGAIGYYDIQPGVLTLQQILARSGYRNGRIGKLHAGPPDQFPHEVEVDVGELGEGRDPEAYDRAVESFLATVDPRPFFLLIGFGDAHRPWPAPGVESGPDAAVEHPCDPAEVEIPGFLIDTPETRVELARYQDSVRRLDRAVKLVLEQLIIADRARNTVVVFTSDNGPGFPFAKGSLHEAGLRVPLIVRWPEIVAPGTRCAALVSTVDVLPTLLDGARIALPERRDGHSAMPLLRGSISDFRQFLFATMTDDWADETFPARSVRMGKYKYIRNFPSLALAFSGGTHTDTFQSMTASAAKDPELQQRCARFVYRQQDQLYDLEADPNELRDLSQSVEHRAAMQDLQQLLRNWMQATGDDYLDRWTR